MKRRYRHQLVFTPAFWKTVGSVYVCEVREYTWLPSIMGRVRHFQVG